MSVKTKAGRLGAAPARKSVDTLIIHHAIDRRQWFADLFGRLLTGLIGCAEAAGDDQRMNRLLAVKSRWIRRGRA